MTHPAILKSIELYNETDDSGCLRDLEPNEQSFCDTVRKILDRKTDAYAAANRVWGDLPRQYRACLIVADEMQRKELDLALENFEQDLDASDELEAVAFAMAEAAE